MKNKKNQELNLFLSAFLIIAYIVCSYFFLTFAEDPDKENLKLYVYAGVFLVFGLLVFYATRVGEGKAIKRFSVATLVVLDLPALYIILAGVAKGMPLHEQISEHIAMMYLAAAALGYGVPYTFFSGFEMEFDEIEDDGEEEVLEGGVEADIYEAEADDAPTYEAEADEIVIEADISQDDTDEAAEEE